MSPPAPFWPALVLISLAAAPASAQDGGLSANLGLSQGLSWSDEDGTSARTGLTFNITSATRSQELALTLGTGLDLAFGSTGPGEETLELRDPNTRLAYSIENRQTALTTALTYDRSEVNDFLELETEPGLLVLDEGNREDITGRTTLEFGREAPFGGSVTLGYAETNYIGTADPDLEDSERINAGLDFRFEIEPRITLTLGYRVSETSFAGGRDVESERLTSGAEFALSPRTDFTISLGLARESTIEGAVTDIEEGVTYGLTVIQDRPAGSLQFSLDGDVTENGLRTDVTVGGVFETRRGNFDGRVGLTFDDNGTARPLIALSYSEDLRRARFTVGAEQAFSTTNDGDDVLNTRLSVGYQQDLTSTARFGTNLSYQISDVLGIADDTTRLEIGTSFSRDLTEDWALTARYTYAEVKEDSGDTDTDNSLFIGFETTFGWRP
ncbi:MAG: hypothetical protein AAGL89_15190 [Pseudomonadota bacterium]